MLTKMWAKQNLPTLLEGVGNGTATSVCQVPRELTARSPRDPAVPPLGVYLRELKTDVCTQTSISALFIIAKK